MYILSFCYSKHQDYEIATLEAANAVQCPVKENPPKRYI